jgi:hypothetical protein
LPDDSPLSAEGDLTLVLQGISAPDFAALVFRPSFDENSPNPPYALSLGQKGPYMNTPPSVTSRGRDFFCMQGSSPDVYPIQPILVGHGD